MRDLVPRPGMEPGAPALGARSPNRWKVVFSLTASALDGEKGTGKTLSLCHVIHFCAKQDWLILHIPDGKNFPHYVGVSYSVTVVTLWLQFSDRALTTKGEVFAPGTGWSELVLEPFDN